jgi:hypothetical protein
VKQAPKAENGFLHAEGEEKSFNTEVSEKERHRRAERRQKRKAEEENFQISNLRKEIEDFEFNG